MSRDLTSKELGVGAGDADVGGKRVKCGVCPSVRGRGTGVAGTLLAVGVKSPVGVGAVESSLRSGTAKPGDPHGTAPLSATMLSRPKPWNVNSDLLKYK